MAYHEHLVLIDSEVKCILCDEVIQDNGRLIEAHLHDRNHREHYIKNLMTTNNITIGTTDLFCYICHCRIEISELVNHVQSSMHQSKLVSISELTLLDGKFVILPENNSSDSYAKCIICDRSIEFMYDTIKDHILSANHKRTKALVLQPLNGIFSVEGNDNYLWCKICQIFFDNYIELILYHVEKPEHAKKMAKLMRLIDGQNININKYLQDIEDDRAFCNKCGIEVPCNVDNLQTHIRGKKHKSQI